MRTAPDRGGARWERGQSLVEYAALVAVVVAMILALTTLRAHRPGRVPIDPVRSVGAVLRPPPVARPAAPRVPPRARPARARPAGSARPRRPRPPRPVVRVPRWWVGP